MLVEDTVTAARFLVGCSLLRIDEETGEVQAAGRIVETEAYLSDDPASHSFKGPTARNRSMFLAAGYIYVYRIYGIHRCVNVVTGPEGIGEAILIRALEPLWGLDVMWKRRYGREMPDSPGDRELKGLCSGPAKLTVAMGIRVGGFDGRTFGADGPLCISTDGKQGEQRIIDGPRIGISRGEALPYRFCLEGSAFLSRPAGGEESS